ncbi:MAG TPA: hypothetical protein DF282_13135 [Hyphomonas sp.]|nr:hypothetical protein [Hyphomonas sp.]
MIAHDLRQSLTGGPDFLRYCETPMALIVQTMSAPPKLGRREWPSFGLQSYYRLSLQGFQQCKNRSDHHSITAISLRR